MIYDAKDCAGLRNGVLLTSVAAWGALVASPEPPCHGPASAFLSSVGGSMEALAAAAPGWLLMLVAMMAPMLLRPLYQIRISSFVSRRWRSSLLLVSGYVLMWMAAGVLLSSVELTARRLAAGSYAPALALGVIAFIWQISPLKQRCLNRCHDHRVPAAFGLAADWDALRMGLEHGLWCVGSCWATMLTPMLLPRGHLAGMAAVTVLMICERLDGPAAPSWRLRGFHGAFLALRLRWLGPRASTPPYTTAPSA